MTEPRGYRKYEFANLSVTDPNAYRRNYYHANKDKMKPKLTEATKKRRETDKEMIKMLHESGISTIELLKDLIEIYEHLDELKV